jgi:hypothetical protein
MKILQGLIAATFGGLLIAFLFIYGIDRELARRDYESGQEAIDCIFESNCEYYNSQKTEFFKG